MKKTKAKKSKPKRLTQTAFRLGDELIDRVDRYANQYVDLPGKTLTRSEAVRILLHRALDKIESVRKR